MNDPGAPEIDVQALMAQIREEIAPRRGNSPSKAQRQVVDSRPLPTGAAIDPKTRLVRLRDLCHLQDRAFVDAAYRAILNRAPDPNGEEHHLGLLRNGTSKAGVLRKLRDSPEGEVVGAKIDDLTQSDDEHSVKPEEIRMAQLREPSRSHDTEFVDAAYRAVLKRAPDSIGEEHYLGLLRNGASKAEILHRLRHSPEGEAIGAKIVGLMQSDVALAATPPNSPFSRLGDFARLHDTAFVDAAYQAVLNRAPDSIGEEYYLGLLRSGASRAEILGRLRYSTEGKAIGTPIDGLARAYWLDKLARWPVVGRIVGVFMALWALPDSERRLRATANDLARLGAQAGQQCKLVERASRDALGDIKARVSLLADELAARATREETAVIRTAMTELRELVRAFDGSKASVAEMERLHQEVATNKVNRQELALLEDSLTAAIGARPSGEQFDRLTGRCDELGGALAGLRRSKADASQIDMVRAEARMTFHRGIDDVNRTFRNLLESKADEAALADAKSDLEAASKSRMATVMQAVHALDGKKLDAGSLEIIREETKAALSGGLSGLEAAFDFKLASLTEAVRSIEVIREETKAALREGLSGLEVAFGSKLDSLTQPVRLEEAKAALLDELNRLEATFDSRLASLMQELRVIEAQKVDTADVQAIQGQFQSALRAGLEGMTRSIAALAAAKVDRGMVSAMLADYSQGIRK